MFNKSFIPVKSDVIFRLFFADERNREFLVALLRSLLHLPDDDFDRIEIADPLLLPEFDGDKLSVVDVKLYTASRKIIHIEIQLQISSTLRHRIVLYGAKLIAEQIGSGQDYDAIQKVISIIILDNNLIQESDRYHHRFIWYDPSAGVSFTDIQEIHTLELKKLPQNADGTALYDWAKFIAAESDEDLDRIANRSKDVSKAVYKYRELTAEEQTRNIFERREKARRDQAALEKDALERGLQQGMLKEKHAIALNLLRVPMSSEQISLVTGLTLEEVEMLKDG